MPQNVAEKLLLPMLREDHRLVSGLTERVQTALNQAAGIGLQVQTVEFAQDMAEGLVHKLTNGQYEDTSWVLGAPVVNFSQSITDRTLQRNVEFHAHAGLKPRISREAESHCCTWCEDLEGTYDYGSEPKDIYRRHDNCRCEVDYRPGDGRRQGVWDKEWHADARPEDILERQKEMKQELPDGRLTQDERLARLTNEELGALIRYKSFDSYLLNELLRKEPDLSQLPIGDQVWVRNLDSALQKMPNYQGDLIRAVDFTGWPEKKMTAFLAEYEPGTIVVHPQYLSTTYYPEYNPNAQVQLHIFDSQKGKDISMIGLDEGEVLYPRNQAFFVEAKEEVDGVWHILLSEVT